MLREERHYITKKLQNLAGGICMRLKMLIKRGQSIKLEKENLVNMGALPQYRI